MCLMKKSPKFPNLDAETNCSYLWLYSFFNETKLHHFKKVTFPVLYEILEFTVVTYSPTPWGKNQTITISNKNFQMRRFHIDKYKQEKTSGASGIPEKWQVTLLPIRLLSSLRRPIAT